MKVLLVEDDATTVEAVQVCLDIHRPDATMISTEKGSEALELLKQESPDVVILDLGLPDMDGIEVLENIRHTSTTPVLIISGRDTQNSLTAGLDLGAEDYIVKPIHYLDFLSRLNHVLRPPVSGKERKISGGGLEIDVDEGRVVVDGKPVELTPTEWGVLTCLMENAGKIVPLQRLASQVWNSDTIDYWGIKETASALRSKLGDDLKKPRIIVSEHEVGYRFMNPE
ncbi:MAG: response regulator transcription factor [Dehalococcoidia bacterium]